MSERQIDHRIVKAALWTMAGGVLIGFAFGVSACAAVTGMVSMSYVGLCSALASFCFVPLASSNLNSYRSGEA